MQSGDQMLSQIVDKSAVDADFRQQLLSDPKAAISRELDIAIPESMNIVVHESDMQTVHLALPPTRICQRSSLKPFRLVFAVAGKFDCRHVAEQETKQFCFVLENKLN